MSCVLLPVKTYLIFAFQKHISEMAMRSKIDKALGGKESLPDGGKGKRRAWDDFNLPRVVPKPFRSTYPKS